MQTRNKASGAITANLSYDPLGRIYNSNNHTAAGSTYYLYDGDKLYAEYDAAGTRLRFYGHGPGVDDPFWWYEPGTHYYLRFLHKNHQGSIVAVTSWSGANPTLAINTYDEYGIPAATNSGRFQYSLPEACAGHMAKRTQIWLPEIGMYYYKARIYSPTLGRFLQTDPIGYEDRITSTPMSAMIRLI